MVSGNITTDITSSLLYFYNSPTFSVIKFLIGIYVVVIIVDIILMLYQRGLAGDVMDTRFGMSMPKEFTRKKAKLKLAERWKKLKEDINSGDEARMKAAIIQADDIITRLIRRMYTGAPFAAKDSPADIMFDTIPVGQIENLADIKNSHLAKNRIIHDDNFHPTIKEAVDIIKPFEEFLHYYRVL
ncbi:MAG TPA: hypothetical protein VK255_01720 [Patescibacteria group bacterium]|nr:hypothetical protein [Patescibacteria group bacterium]